MKYPQKPRKHQAVRHSRRNVIQIYSKNDFMSVALQYKTIFFVINILYLGVNSLRVAVPSEYKSNALDIHPKHHDIYPRYPLKPWNYMIHVKTPIGN